MIIKVKNDIIFKNKNPIELEKSNNQMKSIKKYFDEFTKENKEVYNGNIYCITNITKKKNETIFEVSKTKFEDVVYSKKHFDLKTRCLFVGTYFITSDGYYCIIKNNRNIVNLIGGIADESDFEDGSFNPKKCLYREIREEIGLDIQKNQNIAKIDLKYLKVPSEQEYKLPYYTIGIIYETFLNMTLSELKKEFNKNNDIIDGEIKEIILLKDFSILERYEKKASYLIELFECIKNEKM